MVHEEILFIFTLLMFVLKMTPKQASILDQLGTRNIFRIRALGLKCCKLRELFCNLESILYKENFFCWFLCGICIDWLNLRKFVFSEFFPVNVLREEITFQKASPVIKLCLAADKADTCTTSSKRKRTGRKRSAEKVEDEKLVKRIKTGEGVERNERQRKQFEEMNKGTCESFSAALGREINVSEGRGGSGSNGSLDPHWMH